MRFNSFVTSGRQRRQQAGGSASGAADAYLKRTSTASHPAIRVADPNFGKDVLPCWVPCPRHCVGMSVANSEHVTPLFIGRVPHMPTQNAVGMAPKTQAMFARLLPEILGVTKLWPETDPGVLAHK
jgi:hypothetical protein